MNDAPPLMTDEQKQKKAFEADPKRWLEIREWRAKVKDAFQRGLMVGISIGLISAWTIQLVFQLFVWYTSDSQ